jgi:nucleoside-diphosphate-sugar epimerase
MRVFLAGATGVLGSRVVPLLAQVGHHVTAMARTPEKANALRAAGAEPVTVGLFDPNQLVDAVAGHDAVINVATHIPDLSRAARASAWDENDRIRIDGSRNLVDAALAAGASHFVQESVSFFYVDGGDDWLDEDSGLDVPPFAASILSAEAQAVRFAEGGEAGVVLRFGWFYGAGSSHTASQIRLARLGLSPFPGAPNGYQTGVHLDDAATAVVAALEVPSGVYNVTENEPDTRRELAAAIGEALGRKAGRAVPGVVRLGGAKMAYLSRSNRVSNRKFRDATGWSPSYPTPGLGWRQVVAQVTKSGAAARVWP